MEGILRASPMSLRIDQRIDQPNELNDGAWPAMQEQDRQSVGVLRTHMKEVDVEIFDSTDVLRVGVGSRLEAPPIVVIEPVIRDLAGFVQGHPLLPTVHRFLVRPADTRQTTLQVVDHLVRNANAERPHGLATLFNIRCFDHGPQDPLRYVSMINT